MGSLALVPRPTEVSKKKGSSTKTSGPWSSLHDPRNTERYADMHKSDAELEAKRRLIERVITESSMLRIEQALEQRRTTFGPDLRPLEERLQSLTTLELETLLEGRVDEADVECDRGAFLPSSATLAAFEHGRDVAVDWLDKAGRVLDRVRDGRATTREQSLLDSSFAERFGPKETKHWVHRPGPIAKPSIQQTAFQIVDDLVTKIRVAMPKLQPNMTPGVAAGSMVFDPMGNRAERQKLEFTNSGARVFCGQGPTGPCEWGHAAEFSPADNAITICPNAFGGHPEVLGFALIHELVHALVQPGTTDVYSFRRLYALLNAAPDQANRAGGLALKNPDSIAHFVQMLARADDRPRNGVPPDDEYQGFQNPIVEQEVRLAIALAQEHTFEAHRQIEWFWQGFDNVESSWNATTPMGEGARHTACRVGHAFSSDPRSANLRAACSRAGAPQADGKGLYAEVSALINQAHDIFMGNVFRVEALPMVDTLVSWSGPDQVFVDERIAGLDRTQQIHEVLLGLGERPVTPQTASTNPFNGGPLSGMTPALATFIQSL